MVRCQNPEVSPKLSKISSLQVQKKLMIKPLFLQTVQCQMKRKRSQIFYHLALQNQFLKDLFTLQRQTK